jgi:polyhydroxyalkanoate synthesis regulator phasin
MSDESMPDEPPTKQTTDGYGYPAVKKTTTSEIDISPVQVVLAKGTFLKFALMSLGSLLISISTILAFYWRSHFETKSHIANGTIHLTSGERSTLETKVEAQKHRKKLVGEVSKKVELHFREIKVRQDEQIKRQIKNVADDLKTSQKYEFNKILQEVKRTRREVRNSH